MEIPVTNQGAMIDSDPHCCNQAFNPTGYEIFAEQKPDR